MEVVLRAAVGTTSINGVTTNTSDTPNRKTVMDWLHTLEKDAMLDAVNDILAMVAMTVLDRGESRTICIDFIDCSSVVQRNWIKRTGDSTYFQQISTLQAAKRNRLLLVNVLFRPATRQYYRTGRIE